MTKIEIDLSPMQMKEIHDEYEKTMTDDNISKKIIELVGRLDRKVSLANLIYDCFGLESKVQELQDSRIRNLSKQDRFILMVYWMLTDS